MPEDQPASASAPRGRASAVTDYLREEATGGRLLLLATAVALLWANLAGDSYRDVRDAHVAIGPHALHLDLSLGAWASDGLLAIFFFVAGLEVKRELTVGELADRRAAALPFFAAAGGMLAPALVAIAVSGGRAAHGGAWAIPVATDIAFALGVLAVAGSALPSGVRVLLLSIAVIDDLVAIALIAVLFTTGLSFGWLAAGLALGLVYWLALRRRLDSAWLLWGLAIAAWVCIHASGVHATVTGILLGLLTPVRPRIGEVESPGARMEHRLHPISAGIAVPLFALGAAGISLAAVGDAFGDAIAIGAFAGLLVGKVIGIFGGARLAVALGLGTLPAGVRWGDVLPVAVLGAIGYTVSLLIGHLAFDDVGAQERAAAAVLMASAIASLAAVVLLRRRAVSSGAARSRAGA
jgi:NhaA family Na+:H+ antiporter